MNIPVDLLKERWDLVGALLLAKAEGAMEECVNAVAWVEDHVKKEVFVNADLWRVDLRRACLSGVNLSGADLRESDLREADFRGADLRNAVLIGSNLKGSDFTGALVADSFWSRQIGTPIGSWVNWRGETVAFRSQERTK